MPQRETVVLLDVDGVLIVPRGYRASINASMEYLLERMNLRVDAPAEEISARFEAVGITCEWDMLPLLVALALEAVAGCGATPPADADLHAALEWARAQNLGRVAVDFETEIPRFQACLGLHTVASEAVYRAQQRGEGLFPHLGCPPFLAELLCETRLLRKSLTSMLVQNHALGARRFTESYGCPPLVETESLLEQLDVPSLEPGVAAWLVRQQSEARLRLAVLTARPSLAPTDAPLDGNGRSAYAPEAELALTMVGLPGTTLIGYGRLQWLAEQTGVDPDATMKPSGVHALAAIRAALTGEEARSLLWASAVTAGQADGAGLPRTLDVHVFEDSTVGMLSAQRACQTLRAHDCDARLHCWGVTPHVQKAAALRAVGATVYADVNQAMRAAFGFAAEGSA